jgi:tetratricopeptide (TPR) repeat protein
MMEGMALTDRLSSLGRAAGRLLAADERRVTPIEQAVLFIGVQRRSAAAKNVFPLHPFAAAPKNGVPRSLPPGTVDSHGAELSSHAGEEAPPCSAKPLWPNLVWSNLVWPSLVWPNLVWPNLGKTPKPLRATRPILICLSLCLCVSVVNPLFAADKEHLAMLAAAQAAFDRVEHMAAPPLADSSACVQTQAAMLSVALPGEESELHYRKGFCELAVAAVTRTPSAFTDAAAELDHAGASMLAWLVRRAGHLTDEANWGEPDSCPKSCEPLIPVAKLWRGWVALKAGNAFAAAVQFDALPNSGWPRYVAGQSAYRSGGYAESVARYRQALDIWTQDQQDPNPSLALRLSPPEDIPQLLTELGGAQILAGDMAGAVATLDRALQASPKPRAYFLRARAKELAGQSEGALADYNLASRAAFADANDLASGEAHLYRGILLYRRKDYVKAEEEFASALNFEIAPTLRTDASAWRHLSAVASGFCGASRQYLEKLLPSVSPYFPKAEAEALAHGCPAAGLFP